MTVQVGYAGQLRRMEARVVGDWKRGTIVMRLSASSGPKDYIFNRIELAFQDRSDIDRICMLCPEYRNPKPFCLFRIAGKWYDCACLRPIQDGEEDRAPTPGELPEVEIRVIQQ